jgi:putative two-component system response regulator
MHTDDSDSATCAGGAGRILIVDDMDGNRRLMASILASDGHLVEFANNGRAALHCVATAPPDLILMDVMMPDLDGFEACRALKRDPSSRLIPVVLVTALQNADDRLRGIDAGADDFLSKPFNAHELRARVRSLIRIKRYTDDLDTAESVIVSLALTIEARDQYTDGHCQRLALYASALGRQLGLDEADVRTLARGGFLHDIGKVGVPDAVLNKPGALSPEELAEMRRHPIYGRDVIIRAERETGVKDDAILSMAKEIVYTHHEWWDGTGYPEGLVGPAIPIAGRLMALVDVYDACSTRTLYRPPLSHDDTVTFIISAKGTHFDPAVVDAFITVAPVLRIVSQETEGLR